MASCSKHSCSYPRTIGCPACSLEGKLNSAKRYIIDLHDLLKEESRTKANFKEVLSKLPHPSESLIKPHWEVAEAREIKCELLIETSGTAFPEFLGKRLLFQLDEIRVANSRDVLRFWKQDGWAIFHKNSLIGFVNKRLREMERQFLHDIFSICGTETSSVVESALRKAGRLP